MRTAAAVELNSEQRQALERMARSRSLPARVVERARIVLLAAEGLENKQIAQRMGMTPEKAARWHVARTGAENRVGVGGISLYRNGLSLGAVCEARACVGDDDEPLCHARHLLAACVSQPVREPQPDRLHGVV